MSVGYETILQAMAMGMVNRVGPADRLEVEAMALAREIAQIDGEAIVLTKAAIDRTFEIASRASIECNLEIDTMIEAAETPERVEFNRLRKERGLQAALAWRNARFGGA
jgi:enoyl-CoA hydratase